MAKAVHLDNGKTWPTQTAAESHFLGIRDSYEVGNTVTLPDHVEDIRALLRRYDLGWDGPLKSDREIVHFSVGWSAAEGRTTKCLYIHYADGSKDDFSIRKAVSHKPT